MKWILDGVGTETATVSGTVKLLRIKETFAGSIPTWSKFLVNFKILWIMMLISRYHNKSRNHFSTYFKVPNEQIFNFTSVGQKPIDYPTNTNSIFKQSTIIIQ